MAKIAIVATINTVAGKRDEYLEHLLAHGQRCKANEPGTLKFEIVVPHNEVDTIMLYEVYADKAALDAHLSGTSMQQMKRDSAGLQAGLKGTLCDLYE